MKGYMISNGAVVMSENNGNVIGYMELATNGKRAKINIPTKYADAIHLINVSHLIGAFNYATNHNCPVQVHIGKKFGIWMNTKGWNLTSWDEMDDLNKMFSILYKA